jgi:hypothetical protein
MRFDDLLPALAAARRGAADTAQIHATASRVPAGDPDAWLWEWLGTAGETWATGSATTARPRAVAHLRRAATYYATALQSVGAGSEPGRGDAIRERQWASWDRIVELTDGERLALRYEDTELPGVLFRAADEPRPLLIVNRGFCDTPSQAWVDGGAAAAERGWHWLTFDGPGQGAALHRLGLTARPDWETVLTPLLDTLLDRDDIDSRRIYVVGTTEGAALVARALAFEHRVAAGATSPGATVTDWRDELPAPARAAAGDPLALEHAAVRDAAIALAKPIAR